MKSREEQLTWAKQRALICVDMGHFSDAVAFLRADLDANPLTKGVVSSDHARRGYSSRIFRGSAHDAGRISDAVQCRNGKRRPVVQDPRSYDRFQESMRAGVDGGDHALKDRR